VVDGKHVEELEKTQDFLLYFHRRAKFQEGEEFFAEAIKHLDEKNPSHHPALALLLANQAWVAYQLDKSQAEALAQRALSLTNTTDLRLVITRMKTLNTLANIFRSSGNYEKAKMYAEEALNLAQSQNDTLRTALYLNSLAIINEKLGNYDKAEEYYLAAKQIYEAQNNQYELCQCLYTLGHLNLARDRTKDALKLFLEGLKLAEGAHLLTVIAQFLDGLSAAYYDLKDFIRAKNYSLQALKHLHESGTTFIEADLLINLGRTEMALHNYAAARRHLSTSLRFFWQSNADSSVTLCVAYLAELALKQGNLNDACLWWNVVLNHPATEQKIRKLTQQYLHDLQGQLSTEQLRKITQEAKQTNLNGLVTSMVWLEAIS
jgi:tetratricopeptide (TPR) repeat protein